MSSDSPHSAGGRAQACARAPAPEPAPSLITLCVFLDMVDREGEAESNGSFLG